jgi:DNA-binding CsgD family transcriptional regulator
MNWSPATQRQLSKSKHRPRRPSCCRVPCALIYATWRISALRLDLRPRGKFGERSFEQSHPKRPPRNLLERLKRSDLCRLLEFSQGLLELRSAEAFRRYLFHGLQALVSSEFSSYGEIDPTRPPGEMGRTWVEPLGLNPPEYTEWSQKLFAEEPTWLHFQKSGTRRSLAHSDFYSAREYRETEHYALYNEIAAPIRDGMVVYQGHASGLLLSFAAVRSKRCSARDRLMFDAISPHVFRASLNVKAFSDLSGEVHQLHSAIETLGRAAVIVSKDLRVAYSSERATVWMEEYFPGYHGKALPDRIDLWLRQQIARALIVDDVAAPAAPFRACGPGGSILVRLASLPSGWLLLLEKQQIQVDVRMLRSLPITRREAEILAYVAMGKTNPEIATILDISRLTVKKHLEHIFQALSVDTRTAAAAAALEVSSSVLQR